MKQIIAKRMEIFLVDKCFNTSDIGFCTFELVVPIYGNY